MEAQPRSYVVVGLIEGWRHRVDLGAHLGTFAIPAAQLGAQVVAVEGSPRNAAVLRAACEQNGLDNIEIVEAVVDSKIGEVEFVDLGPYGTISTPDICS
jgi:FkbM family methyltransferase